MRVSALNRRQRTKYEQTDVDPYDHDKAEKEISTEQLLRQTKSNYILDDPILCRYKQGEEDHESWIISDIFRFMENNDKNLRFEQKYRGKVKFTKVNFANKSE